MITNIQTRLFLKLFVHRDDAYMQKNAGPGWMPVRDAKLDRPFGEGQALSHLEGRCRLGVYALKPSPANSCIWVAADFDDNKEAFEQAWSLHEYLKEERIYSLVERSFSGKGYHVWVFMESPVYGHEARTLLLNALIKTGIPLQGATGKGKQTTRAFDRLFPSQDETRNYGNQIGLPLQGEAIQLGNCAFIGVDQKAYPDQWAKLQEAYDNRVPANHPKLMENRLPTAPPIQRIKQYNNTDEGVWLELGKLEGQLERMQGCEAIKASIHDPNQFNNTMWTSILTNIAVFSETGRELAHRVSRNYDRRLIDSDPGKVYSEDDTDQIYNNKVDYLQRSGTPPTCRYLEEQGWLCPKRKAKTCALNIIALYGAPPSYSYYSSTISLTAEDRAQLYKWEQNGGYESFLRHFSDSTDFGVYKGDAIRGVKAKEYWILKHLLGDTRLFAKYPTFNNRVRSIWFEWDTEEDANRFEDQIRQMKFCYEREERAFWLLQQDGEYTASAAEELIRRIAQLGDIQLALDWNDPLILMDPYRSAPYFGKWKEYCI